MDIDKIVEIANRKESDDTVVFDIDFSNKAQAKKKLDEFKTKSIQAFTKFIKESKRGTYLSYTIRRANSRFSNDYILYFSILFDYGYYKDKYKIEIKTSLGSQTTTLRKKVASKASTIESVIKDFASTAVSCLAPLYESLKKEASFIGKIVETATRNEVSTNLAHGQIETNIGGGFTVNTSMRRQGASINMFSSGAAYFLAKGFAIGPDNERQLQVKLLKELEPIVKKFEADVINVFKKNKFE